MVNILEATVPTCRFRSTSTFKLLNYNPRRHMEMRIPCLHEEKNHQHADGGRDTPTLLCGDRDPGG